MKKSLLIALAAATLVSCSQEEIVETADRVAISFDNVFVQNSTRAAADLSAANLQNFAVYGSVAKDSQTGNIFNRQEVTGSQSGGYTYSPLQYWIPGASYHFTAIAPSQEAHWTYTPLAADASTYGTKQAQYGTITFNNKEAGAEQDLLWAYQTKTTDATVTTSPGKVGFTFSHILSRAKFTFKNGFAVGSNISLKVKEVKITNAHSSATIALSADKLPTAWTPASETFPITFGEAGSEANYAPQASATTAHLFLIPVNGATYNVTFKVDLYQAGVKILSDIEKTTSIANLAMQRGFSYEFSTVLNDKNTSNEGDLQPIEFQVEGVNGWTESNVTVETPTI